MYMLPQLMSMQEATEKLKDANRILKDGSYIYLLNKLKREFEYKKGEHANRCEKLESIKATYKKLSKDIKGYKEKQALAELEFLNKLPVGTEYLTELECRIEQYRSEIKKLRAQAIVLQEKEEKYMEEKELLRVQLLHLKENFKNYKEIVQKKMDKAKKEAEEAQKTILEVKKVLPTSVLEIYEEIQAVKGDAVVKILGGACSGCKRVVSSRILSELYHSEEIVLCEHCSRILYKEEQDNLQIAK